MLDMALPGRALRPSRLQLVSCLDDLGRHRDAVGRGLDQIGVSSAGKSMSVASHSSQTSSTSRLIGVPSTVFDCDSGLEKW